MRVKMNVKVADNMGALVRGIPALADKTARHGALALLEEAKRECPVDTGKLRDSHTVEGGQGEYSVVADTPYAVYVHWGTRHMRANPWLARAAEHANPRIMTEIRDDLADGIARYETHAL